MRLLLRLSERECDARPSRHCCRLTALRKGDRRMRIMSAKYVAGSRCPANPVQRPGEGDEQSRRRHLNYRGENGGREPGPTMVINIAASLHFQRARSRIYPDHEPKEEDEHCK